MQTPIRVTTKRCEHCHGNLFLEKDGTKWVYMCMMCNRSFPLTSHKLPVSQMTAQDTHCS